LLTRRAFAEGTTERPNACALAREQATIIASASNPVFRKWEKPFTLKNFPSLYHRQDAKVLRA